MGGKYAGGGQPYCFHSHEDLDCVYWGLLQYSWITQTPLSKKYSNEVRFTNMKVKTIFLPLFGLVVKRFRKMLKRIKVRLFEKNLITIFFEKTDPNLMS